MPKRIKLLLDLSGIDEGVSHLIYRGETLPVPIDTPLMEAEEREVYKRPLSKAGEVLVQDADAPLIFHVSRVFMMMPHPTIYIDGTMIASANITLYPREKKIRIDNEQIDPMTTKVVTMDYQYLVSVIEDDYTIAQAGLIHRGSNVITGLNPPVFSSYVFDKLSTSYEINIVRDATPHKAWYQVALREDSTGRLSDITAAQEISIVPNSYDLSYRLEISRDERATWEPLTVFTGNDVTLSNVNDITSYAHVPLTLEVNRLSDTHAEIIFQNPWFEWWNNHRRTHYYRIREEDTRGQVTEYTELPRGGMNYKPTELKIRRKEDNGLPAQYEGFDALDMWLLNEVDVDITQPTIRLVDDHLVAGKMYSYTFYLDDEKGFRSNAFMETTEY